MTSSRRHSGFFREVRLDEMIGLLEDLTTYFSQPSEEEEISKSNCRFKLIVWFSLGSFLVFSYLARWTVFWETHAHRDLRSPSALLLSR